MSKNVYHAFNTDKLLHSEKYNITIHISLTIDSLSVIEKCCINMKRNVIFGVNLSLKYSLAPTAVTSKTNVSDKHK